MSWYKKSQIEQVEMEFEKEIPKRRIKNMDRVVSSVSAMLFQDNISDLTIEEILRDLKKMKDEGKIQGSIGHMIIQKFDKVFTYTNFPVVEKGFRKKKAFDRLRKIMEEMV